MLSPSPTFGALTREALGRQQAEINNIGLTKNVVEKVVNDAPKQKAESNLSELLDMDVLQKLREIFENSETESNALSEAEFINALR